MKKNKMSYKRKSTTFLIAKCLLLLLLITQVKTGYSQYVNWEIFKPRPDNIQETTGAPWQTITLDSLETIQSSDLTTLSRLRGFIIPPQTGYYIFKFTSDYDAYFNLSTDSTEYNKKNICSNYCSGSSLSDSIYLVINKPYYFETFCKGDYTLYNGQASFQMPGNYTKLEWRLSGTSQLQVIKGTSLKPALQKQVLSVNWEIFKNLTSYDFNVLKNTDSIPDEVDKITTINTPDHSTTLDHFASRIRGYIIPPVSGSYSFYFAADDVGQFWLSTDVSTTNAQLKNEILAPQTDWTQNISSQTLSAGQKYFFEILHYDTVSTDMIKLGWLVPGDTTPVAISSPNITSNCDNINVISFSILDKNLTTYPNRTITPSYNLSPWNISNKSIIWESSNDSIATVNADGTIYTIGIGYCQIIAKVATDTTLSDTIFLKVSDFYGPFFVKPNATGDGHTWDNAINLQTLLNIINSEPLQQQITIYASEGTYKPTTSIDRNISFVLNNIRFVGGFAATSSGNDTTSRDIDNHATILSGEIGDQGTTIDNSYHVVKAGYSILDGITIRDGRASCSTYGTTEGTTTNKVDDNGGGILVSFANISLINCKITNNSAFNSAAAFICRGDWEFTCHIDIQNCSIDNNHIQQTIITTGGMFDIQVNGYGGGILASSSILNIRNSVFHDNSTQNNQYGAAILIGSSSIANIESCSFFNNIGFDVIHSEFTGPIYNINNSTIIGDFSSDYNAPYNITNSTIVGSFSIHDHVNPIYCIPSLKFDNSIVTNPDPVIFADSNFNVKNSILGHSLFGNNKYDVIIDTVPNYTNWLDTLNYNGGLTPTMKLKNVPFNYAKTYGNPLYLDSTDQRGVIRKDNVSIGAYQWSSPMPKNQLNYVNWEIFKNKTSYDFNVLKNTDSIPDEVVKLTTINTPDHSTTLDHFTSRIRGYIIPPYDGNYSFYFAADDVGQFWLSTDSSSANAQLKSNIQSIQTDWTQNISTQNLIAGQKYFFEILHYDTVYTDMIKLGWIIPGDTAPVVISTPYIVNGGDNIPVSKFALLDKNVLAYPNWTITPRYQLTPWNASSDAILWTSTDNIVATISTDGIITTQSTGTCQIIAKVATDTTLTDTLYLTVSDYYGPFFVKPEATGDGHTWNNAIDLQTLLTILNRGTLQQQVTIYASEGTYITTKTIDRNISFILKNMRLVGGFPITNTGTDTTNQDYTNHKTILSGEIGDLGTTIDNSYHVVIAGNSVINGITIRDGRASCSSYSQNLNFAMDDNGGGIFGGNLSLINCKITKNIAWNGGAGIHSDGFINILNCSIDNNSIKQTVISADGSMFDVIVNGYGGGMATVDCDLFVKNSSFTYNSSAGYGKVFFLERTKANIENCSFYNNLGGIEDLWSKDGSILNLNNSTVIGSVVSDESSNIANITNSTIIGGGFATGYNSKVILDNSIWTNLDFSQMQDSTMFEAKYSIVKKKLYGDNKYNVITDSIPNYTLWLDSLNNNGGLTPTIKLKNVPFNYAKTYGNPIYLDSTDQRGVIRKDSVSIGAYQWVKPNKITISPKQVTLCLGDSINVSAAIQPTIADDSTFIIYSLVDSIAHVSNSRIHANSGGIVNIIAKTIDGELTDTCHVVVIGKVGGGTISGPANVCSDQNTASYTVSTIPNATSYVWTLPNGNLDTTITNTVYLNINTINQSGILSVKGVNLCGEGQTTTYSITVNPSYNLVVNKTICQGDSIAVGNHIYTTTGVYTDHLPTLFGCDSVITTHLTVNPTPTTPTITQTGNTLNSSAASGNQWYNVASGIINSATAQTYNPTANGYYYTIVTLLGCSSDSSNHFYYSNTGIETIKNNKTIKVYPNPVSNELIIEMVGNKENVSFEIYNSIGQSIYKGNLIEKTTVQTTNFAQGVYIIKLENGKLFEFKKIVKE